MLLYKDFISYFPDYPLSNNNDHLCNKHSFRLQTNALKKRANLFWKPLYLKNMTLVFGSMMNDAMIIFIVVITIKPNQTPNSQHVFRLLL